MGRFDRETNREEADAVAVSAADTLRHSIEQQVREVVEEAMGRAATIEDRAQAQAAQIEQESRYRAERILKESQERGSQVLSTAIDRAQGIREATETLQSELGKVIDSFRQEIDLLTTELRTAREGLLAPPDH